MYRVALITGSRDTADSLYKQLHFFLNNKVDLHVYVVDEGFDAFSDEELFIYSSQALFDEVKTLIGVPTGKIIIGHRTINYDSLEEIVDISSGEKVLLVNDVEKSAKEVELALNALGLNQMSLEVYYPGCTIDISEYETAITPGELSLVPNHIKRTIDIGSRVFDFKTIARILTALNLLEESSVPFSKMYHEKIINIARNLSNSKSEISRLNANLSHVIESLNAGLLMVNTEHKLVFINDYMRKVLRLGTHSLEGKTVEKVVHNRKLQAFIQDRNAYEEIELTLDANTYSVSKFLLSNDHLTGITLKATSNNLNKNEINKKGYIAKYSVDDIVGSSVAIKKLKGILPKLAITEMSLLITGESGTGKELLASAVHNLSSRANAPFLAVNFSALSDELIESELFGYVEGAFTGAKKGGKLGLFEEANGGTIFLDEIGDISLKVQSRLLRVLEEREIMPLGSAEIKPIDVRVIAATNKNLKRMVEEKTFREDLYFRLKMGTLHLPPLNQRSEDIPLIVNHLVNVMSTTPIVLDDGLIKALSSYDWPGNIRELKNTVSYMLAVRESNYLTIEDLPDEVFGHPLEGAFETQEFSHSEFIDILSDDEAYFLKLIVQMLGEDVSISRTVLAHLSQSGPFKRTENQVRRILMQLSNHGMITLSKGRNGIKLTQKGKDLISSRG